MGEGVCISASEEWTIYWGEREYYEEAVYACVAGSQNDQCIHIMGHIQMWCILSSPPHLAFKGKELRLHVEE